MMCCNKCPFHPILGNTEERCTKPLCNSDYRNCNTGFCAKNIGCRCFQDHYVINRLFHRDSIAEELVQYTLKTALMGRDRALLLSLFQAANNKTRMKLWRWLEIYEPRSIWLLNPIFSAVGLLPLDSFIGVGSRRKKYIAAIIANPYSGTHYRPMQYSI